MRNTKENFYKVLDDSCDLFYYSYNKRNIFKEKRKPKCKITIGTRVLILNLERYNNFLFEDTRRKYGGCYYLLEDNSHKIKSIKTILKDARKYIIIIFTEPFNFNYRSINFTCNYTYSKDKDSLLDMIPFSYSKVIDDFYFKYDSKDIILLSYEEHIKGIVYHLINAFLENYLIYEVSGLDQDLYLDEKEIKNLYYKGGDI